MATNALSAACAPFPSLIAEAYDVEQSACHNGTFESPDIYLDIEIIELLAGVVSPVSDFISCRLFSKRRAYHLPTGRGGYLIAHHDFWMRVPDRAAALGLAQPYPMMKIIDIDPNELDTPALAAARRKTWCDIVSALASSMENEE